MNNDTVRARNKTASPLIVGVLDEHLRVIKPVLDGFSQMQRPSVSDPILRVQPYDSMEDLIRAVLAGQVNALLAESTLWLERIQSQLPLQNAALRIVEFTVFAASPILIVMRSSIANRLGYPEKPLGWTDLMGAERITEGRFSWSHASLQSGDGLLTALAIYHADTGKDILSVADLDEASDLLQRLEATVHEYGPSAAAVARRTFADGRWAADAFAAPESVALPLLTSETQDPAILIYPKEGTIWAEHLLALLGPQEENGDAEEKYEVIRDYMISSDGQSRLLLAGLRPMGPHTKAYEKGGIREDLAGLHVMPTSTRAFAAPDAQMQYAALNSWWLTKRSSRICLVVDISGSMEGEKLRQAQRGLEAFVSYFRSDREQLGLIAFNHIVRTLVPTAPLCSNRPALLNAIQGLIAGGRTALLDAVSDAHEKLISGYDDSCIQAVVVMTDGEENGSSKTDLSDLLERIRAGRNSSQPVAVYCIAYGGDANRQILSNLAETSGGSLYEGTVDSIRKTYEGISHFL